MNVNGSGRLIDEIIQRLTRVKTTQQLLGKIERFYFEEVIVFTGPESPCILSAARDHTMNNERNSGSGRLCIPCQ